MRMVVLFMARAVQALGYVHTGVRYLRRELLMIRTSPVRPVSILYRGLPNSFNGHETKEEFDVMIITKKKESAPGPDGLPLQCLQMCWRYWFSVSWNPGPQARVSGCHRESHRWVAESVEFLEHEGHLPGVCGSCSWVRHIAQQAHFRTRGQVNPPFGISAMLHQLWRRCGTLGRCKTCRWLPRR